MNRDLVVYCSCTFLLGLTLGSFVIGPHMAKAPAAPAPVAENPGPMGAVRDTIARLKGEVERDPRNPEPLIQLANMYMDAAKYPDAIGYYERALAIRDDPNVRIDIGICYKQSGQLEKALDSFRRAEKAAPDQWQPYYNEAIVFGEMKRFDEARTLVARLQKMRPGDPEVDKLARALK